MPGSLDPSRANKNDNKQKRKNDKEKPVKRRKVEKAVTERTVYPKRSLTVTSYMDIEIPDDDTFLYCEECNKEYDDNCPVHGPLTFVEDSPISSDVKSCNKAEQSAPRCVIIKESHIPGAGRGIWAKEAIPTRSRFGPYVGEITTDTDKTHSTGYSWQIYKDGKASHFVDANNPETSNWMRYVNCARTEAEQNLTAFQYRGQVYYRAHKPIQLGQELLVWYGQEYGQELGLRRGCSDQSAPIIVKSASSCEDRYCCRECPHIEFSTRIQYYRHTRNKHGSVIPPDVIKEMRLSAKQNSSNMINNHNTQVMKLNLKSKSCDSDNTGISYKCSLCEYKTGSSQDMTRHTRIHTGDQSFRCCKQQGNVDKDLRTHTGEKPFKCSVCEYRCTTRQNLTGHMRTHTGDKPFKCSVCEYRCTQPHDLTRHMRTHTGDKPFKCSVCEYRCTQPQSLTTHMRTHTGDKPFKCSVCEYRCTQPQSLTRHMRTHTGDKPFKCSVCEYRCTQPHDLTRHMRTHTGDKPFKCSVCEYRCTRPHHLTRHIRTHTGDKPFKCFVCEYRCTQQSDVVNHIGSHTNSKIATNPFHCSGRENFSNEDGSTTQNKSHLEE